MRHVRQFLKMIVVLANVVLMSIVMGDELDRRASTASKTDGAS